MFVNWANEIKLCLSLGKKPVNVGWGQKKKTNWSKF